MALATKLFTVMPGNTIQGTKYKNSSPAGGLEMALEQPVVCFYLESFDESTLRNSGKPEFQRSGIPETRNSGDPAFRKSGIPDFRKSGFPEFRISGNPAFQNSGSPEVRKSK